MAQSTGTAAGARHSRAAGALWKARISFGGMEVGVKLHPAVREERMRFHLIHRTDRVRLEQRMVCPVEDLPVPAAEQARGYEVEKGAYVVVEPGDLERAEAGESRLIEVHEFVRAGEIPPLFLGRAYHLQDDRDPRGYASLAAALAELDVAGICTWAMRGRAHYGALESGGRSLRIVSLRYADEVIPADSLPLESATLSEKEIGIGGELVGRLTAPFAPEEFKDEHQARLRAMIERKARGEKVAAVRPRRLKSTGPDRLLEALEASLRKVA